LRNILLPFIIGLIIAYITLPAVSWLEKRLPGRARWKTPNASAPVSFVFVFLVLLLGTGGYYVVFHHHQQRGTISWKKRPRLLFAGRSIRYEAGFLRCAPGCRRAPASRVDAFFNNLGDSLGNIFRSLFSNVIVLVPGTIFVRHRLPDAADISFFTS
jgi:predicted PurR-regulated permease PerM